MSIIPAIYPLQLALQTADVIADRYSSLIQRFAASRVAMRLEGKSRFASCIHTLSCLMAMMVMISLAPAYAQDTGTASESPPVLRGFRLDPDRAKPEPPPPPTTTTTAPQSETKVPTTQPVPRTQPSPRPRTKADEPREPQTRATPAPTQGAPVSIDDGATQTPDAVTADAPASARPISESSTSGPVVDSASSNDNSLLWQLAAAAAALGLVLIGIWWLHRQSAHGNQPEARVETADSPTMLPSIKPAPIAKPLPLKVEAPAPILLEFLPDRAVVSLANLSVSGKLRLTNQSDQPVEQLRLRAALIGASADQAEIISAFHNREDGKEKPLADLKPGEKRDFVMEMALPLTDIPSYAVGSQRLLVPIVIANLAYGNGRDSQIELACVIGREANPPQPKLGPLRLDLGPRSFAPLGQRRLAA